MSAPLLFIRLPESRWRVGRAGATRVFRCRANAVCLGAVHLAVLQPGRWLEVSELVPGLADSTGVRMWPARAAAMLDCRQRSPELADHIRDYVRAEGGGLIYLPRTESVIASVIVRAVGLSGGSVHAT